MSTNYVQKTFRIKWTQEKLRQAIDAVNQRLCNRRTACEKYGIPHSTLERYLKLGYKEKKQLGRFPILGNFEKDLEEFLLNLQNEGVNWTLADPRRVAFEFAEKCNIKHHFNKEKRLANYNWVNSFLNRHSNLIVQTGVKGTLYINQNKSNEVVKEYSKDHIQNVSRCKWTEDQLIQAINSVNNGISSCRSASEKFGIPRTTLIRHIKKGAKEKKQLACLPIFDKYEKELKDFILNEQSSGKTWSMTELRRIAFNFSKIHNIKHKFKKDKGLVSYEWVHAFIGRHPEIVVQSQNYQCSSIKYCELNKMNEFGDMLQIVLKEGDEDILKLNTEA
jgi:hypothetical protein